MNPNISNYIVAGYAVYWYTVYCILICAKTTLCLILRRHRSPVPLIQGKAREALQWGDERPCRSSETKTTEKQNKTQRPKHDPSGTAIGLPPRPLFNHHPGYRSIRQSGSPMEGCLGHRRVVTLHYLGICDAQSSEYLCKQSNSGVSHVQHGATICCACTNTMHLASQQFLATRGTDPYRLIELVLMIALLLPAERRRRIRRQVVLRLELRCRRRRRRRPCSSSRRWGDIRPGPGGWAPNLDGWGEEDDERPRSIPANCRGEISGHARTGLVLLVSFSCENFGRC